MIEKTAFWFVRLIGTDPIYVQIPLDNNLEDFSVVKFRSLFKVLSALAGSKF